MRTPSASMPQFPAHIIQALRENSHRIVITGASGWLGMATLELLLNALGQEFSARVVCFGSCDKMLFLRNGIHIQQQILCDIAFLKPRPTTVLHFAFLGKEYASSMDGISYQRANSTIRDHITNALAAIGTTALFIASSGAAYFAHDANADSSMRLYGRLKADDEAHFMTWAAQHHCSLVIARIFNLAGPYINKPRDYALANFILSALANAQVNVNAPYRVERSYVAIRELIALVLGILLSGSDKSLLFDSGGDPLELGEVAELVAAVLNTRDAPVTASRAVIVDDQMDRYIGDRQLYDTLRAQFGITSIPLRTSIRETAEFLIASATPPR